jgi:two-component system response regulator DesR
LIRVLLAEDQGMMRGALALLLGLEDDFEVVGQVSTGDQIVPVALEVRPDVAVLDIEMPGRSGLDAAADLHAELPACKILIVTTFGRPGYLRRAMGRARAASSSRTARSRTWPTPSAGCSRASASWIPSWPPPR